VRHCVGRRLEWTACCCGDGMARVGSPDGTRSTDQSANQQVRTPTFTSRFIPVEASWQGSLAGTKEP